jgi:hypothetical protein
MCPLCMTNAALVVAGATSSAGVLGLVAVRLRSLRRRRREPRTAKRIRTRVNNERINSIRDTGPNN